MEEKKMIVDFEERVDNPNKVIDVFISFPRMGILMRKHQKGYLLNLSNAKGNIGCSFKEKELLWLLEGFMKKKLKVEKLNYGDD